MGNIISYNKLIRDNILPRMNSEGECRFSRLPEQEFRDVLPAKLDEEVMEYFEAETEGKRLEELCDISEVLYASVESYGYSRQDLDSRAYGFRKEARPNRRRMEEMLRTGPSLLRIEILEIQNFDQKKVFDAAAKIMSAAQGLVLEEGFTLEDLGKKVADKRRQAGGFDGHIFLVSGPERQTNNKRSQN